MMRSAMMLVAAALAAMPATAWAEDWCGYGARPKSLIQCGYSTNTECENAVGKAGMCFVNPEFALKSGGRFALPHRNAATDIALILAGLLEAHSSPVSGARQIRI